MNKALLIIDMQIMPFVWKDYGGKPVYNQDKLLANVKELIEKARNAGSKIFYIMHTEKNGSPRSEGSELWKVHPDISPQSNDAMIVKYQADSFYKTDLEKQLIENDIDSIVVCGLQTEFCIDTICKSAYSKDFGVELAQDAHSTFDSEILAADIIINHHNNILKQFCDINLTKDIKF